MEYEYLFDTQNDPHEIHDLTNDPKYADKLNELLKLWPDGTQPITEDATITFLEELREKLYEVNDECALPHS